MRKLLPLLLVLSGCAHTDEWTTGDTVWQGIATATMLADAYACAQIHKHPNIIEDGAIASAFIGQNPSPTDCYVYMSSVILSNWLISRMLPAGYRTMWQGFTIYRHGSAVNKANQIGLFGEPCTRHQEEHPCP